eukprot:1872835-Rhodomonas_salina.1
MKHRVSVSGLSGASAKEIVSLKVLTDDLDDAEVVCWKKKAGQAGWREKGALVFDICGGKVMSTGEHVISFKVTNPSQPQEAPSVWMEVKEGNRSLTRKEVGRAGTSRLGVDRGGDVLKVVGLGLRAGTVSQSNPFASGMSTLTARLTAGFDVPAGSEVLIKGLTGSPTPSTTSLNTVSVPTGAWQKRGQWKQESGQLRL